MDGMNGGGLFRRPKLTLSCSAEGKLSNCLVTLNVPYQTDIVEMCKRHKSGVTAVMPTLAFYIVNGCPVSFTAFVHSLFFKRLTSQVSSQR
jgi:hypothetical protein